MVKSRKSINNWIIEVFLIVSMLWASVPLVQDIIDRLFVIISLSIAIIIAFFTYPPRKFMSNQGYNVFLLTIAWILYQCFFKLVGLSNSAWGTHSEFIIFYSFLFLLFYVKEQFSQKAETRILVWGFIFLFFSIAFYFFLYLKGELKLTYDPAELATTTIPTLFKSSLVFFALVNYVILLVSKKSFVVLVNIFAIFSSFWLIYVVGNNATAAILLVLGLIAITLSFLFQKAKKQVYTSVVVTILLFLAIIFILFGSTLFTWLANVTARSNIRVSRKLLDIASFLEGGQQIAIVDNDSFITRIYLIRVSVRTWTNNLLSFLFGVGRNAGYYYESGIGQHSEFFDTFARYGLVGGVFTLMIMIKLPRFLCDMNDTNLRRYGFVLYLVFILSCITNSFMYPVVGVSMLLSFLTIDILDKKNTRERKIPL